MDVSFNLAGSLGKALAKAAAEAGLEPDFQPEVRPADPAHADFQANGAFAYARARKQNPQAVARLLVEHLPADLKETFHVTTAGPGFINFSLSPELQLAWLRKFRTEEDLRLGASSACHGRKFVVDFSSPNTAKQMHVGHLRGIFIGEAICRLLDFSGARVIRDNHLGDWGTPYGKILYAYKRFLDPEALKADALEEIERLYKKADALSKDDPAVLEQARQELVKLQGGDSERLALWQEINRASLQAVEEIYRKLEIRFDHHLGESFYRDKVDRVYRELQETGLAEESQGALVVFHREHPRFAQQPFIIRKSDGASNYATTDLATALYRVEVFDADAIIILTDARQQDHFQQLFLTVEKWFAATGRKIPRQEHVTFGSILGEDGKAIKTRSGDPIKLKDLLREAEERAFSVVSEKNPDLPESERRRIASAVGLGAVRYADLSQNRTGDYVFSWQKLLSLEGNTAPYLLYAGARIHSIFRRFGIDPATLDEGPAVAPETQGEIWLARKLVGFPSALDQTITALRPHYLCTYLYELAGAFSTFYNSDKVLVDEIPVRHRRLLLCARTLTILETGLKVLGLQPLQKM